MSDSIAWHSAIAHEFDRKYARHRHFLERKTVWSEFITRYTTEAADVLDAGCGSGIFSFIAAKHSRRVTGIDGSPEMIALCEDKKRRQKACNVAFHLELIGSLQTLAPRRFDLVLCSSVLEYIDDFWLALAQLRDLTRPGGVLLLSMPNGQSLYRWCERAAYQAFGKPAYLAHVRHFPTRRRLVSNLSARGYRVLETRYYAATPVLSVAGRRLGAAALTDNLLLVACQV